MKKLLSKFRIVVPVLMCVFAFTTLMLTGCKDEQPHVHNLELISEKIATCIETGEREHYHCTLCDKNYLTEQAETEISAEDLVIEIDTDNHNYDFATAVYDFHLKTGLESDYECTATVFCSRNDEHAKITETVDATVHVDDADCTTGGEKNFTAEFENKAFGVNGVVSKTEPISAYGHNYGNIIPEVSATCLAEGTHAHYHCDRCDKDFLQKDGVVATAQDLTITKLEHNMEHNERVDATCALAGHIEYWHCSSCNKNYRNANGGTEVSVEDLVIAINPDNHNYDYTTAVYDFHLKAGSETEYECTATVSCSRNTEHAKITETVDATIQVNPADCTTAGEKVLSAEFSNKKFGENGVVSKTEPISALGHNYGTIIAEVPATCLAEGKNAHYHCDRCDKDFLQKDGVVATAQDLTIAKLNHNMTHYESNEATCEVDGNIEYWHCSSCNKNYSDANGETEVENTVVNALGHNYQKEDETTNYVYDYDNNRYVAKCTRCEHTDTTQDQPAGVEGYPYLAKDEATLLSAVEKGGYIKLANDIAVEGVVVISTNVNIDLNGKTISYTQTAADNNGSGERKNYCILNFTGGNSVVSNGAITYNTSITEGVDEGRTISIENDAQLVMQGLSITSDLRGVMVFDNSRTSIINCEITSNMDTISGNNTYGPSTMNLIVNVQNSTITSTNLTAVFMPSYITLNITSNSTVTGKTSAIYAMMGVINVDETSALSSTRETFVARQDAPVSEEDTSNQLKGQGPGDERYDGATIVLRTNYYYDDYARTNELTLNIADWDNVTATSGVKVAVYNFAEDSSFITDAKNNGKPVTNQFVEVCNKLTEVDGVKLDGVKYFLYGTEKVYNETKGTYENQAKLVELSYYQYWLANYAEVEVVDEEKIEYAIIDDHWLFEEVDAIESGFKYGYSFVEQTIINKTTTVSHMFVEWSQEDIKNCGGIDGSLIAFVMSDSSEKFFKVPTDEVNLGQRTLIEGHYIGVKDNDKASVLAFTDDCIMINELENGDYEIQGLFNFDLEEKTGFITVTIAEGSYRYFYLDENTFTVEEYACRVTNEYGETYDEYYFTLEEALLHIDKNTTITLLKDITITQSILIQPETPATINLNLNGKTLTLNVANESDSITFSRVRTSLYDGTIVTNSSLYPIRIISGSDVTVSNLTIEGSICGCFYITDSTAKLSNITATAQEMCVLVWKDTEVTIEDCDFTSKDNAVIMDNGSKGIGNNTVVIRGTTLNGHIQTSGYIACGIYHANSGKWTIGANSEGKNSVLNVYSGAGIVARSGDFVIENGVVFNHITEHPNLTEGKVGDAKINIKIPVDIYRDLAANYPGGKPNVITNNSKVCEALQTQFECVDGEKYYYTSFEKLIAELNGDKTITLLKDLSLQQKLSISPEKTCEIVLDLGGYTINGAMTIGSMIHVMGCTLTIKNGNIVSENAGVGVIRVQGREGADSASKMDNPVAVNTNLILADTLNVTSKSYCLFIFGSGAVVETSANLTNNSTEANVPAVIQTNGNSGSEIGSLTIKGGTITHNTEVALYLPSAGTYIIEGGTIIGSSAVYVKCGTLTITGGTLKATACKEDFEHNGNGCNYTGDALVVEACNYPGGVPTVNINGGTFTITDNTAKKIGVYNYDGYKAVINNNNTDLVIEPVEVSSKA